MPVNFNILQPTAPPQVKTVALPASGGGDDLLGGISGLLGGLKQAFGSNPVSTANQALNTTMQNTPPAQIAQSLTPSSMQSAMQPSTQSPIGGGSALSRYNNLNGSPSPMQNSQASAMSALQPPPYVGHGTSNGAFNGVNGVGIGQQSGQGSNDQLNATMSGIANVESGGSKNPYGLMGPATNSGDRAYGKYQIMGTNIGPWSKEALGQSVTPQQFLQNPQIQDKVASYKLGNYLKQYSPQDTASMWFSGRPMNQAGNAKDSFGTTVPQYVNKFNQGYSQALKGPSQTSNIGLQNIQQATQAAQTGNPYQIASQYLGDGVKSHADTLSHFFNKSLGQQVNPQNTPWCAAFANSVLKSSGLQGTGSLAAKSFLNYGKPTTTPSKGDVVVYNDLTSRNDPAHGHVGFVDSIVEKNGQQYVRTLGGNQGGEVSLKDYPLSKVAGFRVPPSSQELQAKAQQPAPMQNQPLLGNQSLPVQMARALTPASPPGPTPMPANGGIAGVRGQNNQQQPPGQAPGQPVMLSNPAFQQQFNWLRQNPNA